MSRWKSALLNSVATIERLAIQPADIQAGTLYVGLEHIVRGGGLLPPQPVNNGDLASTKFRFTPEHILYGKLRPYLAKIARPDFAGICSTDILPILAGDDLDRRFLLHFLRQPKMVQLASKEAVGANLPRLSPTTLGRFAVPVPQLVEQRRIADILDKADALRAQRRAALAELDRLTQSIFLDLFGDPSRNSKGWEKRPFGEVCETRLGKMLDQKQQTGRNLRPYLRNANVQWFRFNLSEVSEMDFDSAARQLFLLKPGDLLICEGGRPGRAAIWQGQIEECYFQKALHRARPRIDRATPEYLSWLLWLLVEHGSLADHVTSATIAHLTGEKLKAMTIPLPPIELQREFTRRITAIQVLQSLHRAALAELDTLFASLQHRAFRGEL